MPANVFISYSHDSREHRASVLTLSKGLRGLGIDAYIDQYTEHKPPKSWPTWMRRKINEADYVLVICTETYRRRFEGEERKGRGRGAKWEGAIIELEMYDEELNSDDEESRFIPVVLRSDDSQCIPRILGGTTYYDVSHEERYRSLVARLKGIRTVEMPPLGNGEGEQSTTSASPPASKVEVRSRTPEGRYRALLTDELGTIRMLGSPDVPNLPVGLLDAFVHLDISMSWRCEMRFEPESRAELNEIGQDLSPDEVMRRAFERGHMLLVIGDPGAGKTTLLGYYAMCCLQNDRHRKLGFDEAPLPIYFPLRETAFRKDGRPLSLAANLERWAENYELHIPRDQFDRWLHERPTLLLLDGLDEIRNVAQRRSVCQWIDRRAKGLRDARFVVTSRWTGYRKSEQIELGCDHLRADIKDFSAAHQEEFITNWFKAAFLREPRAAGESPAQWRQTQQQKGTRLARRVIDYLNLDDNKSIRQLASVPMLLQIIAVIWKERHVLLRARGDLYEAAVKYLLDYRDSYRDIVPLLTAKKAIRVLSPLAMWMQDELHKDELERKAMHEQVQAVLDTMDDQIQAKAFCQNVRDRAGLIADYGQDHYIFRHKSIREYLAGLELVKQARENPQRMAQIVRHVGDDWWEEVLRFFMAEADDWLFDRFMQAFFKSKASRQLDPKVQALLRTLISEAPQKRVDSLVKCLNDRRFAESKKRYVLDCLNAIGTEQALTAVRDYLAQAAPGASAERAEEIVAVHETLKVTDAVSARITEKPFAKGAKSFRNPLELNAEYILIPGGAFTYSANKQAREVGDLYFAKYPVTNRRYRRFMRYLQGQEGQLHDALPREVFAERLLAFARGSEVEGFAGYLGSEAEAWADKLRSTYDNDKRFGGEDQPVVGVSWYAARAYCLWLSQLEATTDGGIEYRLPTEIEWEWAASGGTREYPWGDDSPDDKRANYAQNVGATTPVGQYPQGATPDRLMDMAGNVCEWMEDFESKSVRLLRGGSWLNHVSNLRCSVRFFSSDPENRLNHYGFRVVYSQS